LTGETKQQQLEWRRGKVLELSSQGYSQREIAGKLSVDVSAVSRDIFFLKQQAQKNLQKHINETVPLEYNKCMTAMKINLKDVLEIGDRSEDPRIKLEAKKIANETLRYIMELVTGGVICTQAFNSVIQTQEKITVLQKIDERINQQIDREEEETTTNGVF
jgi:hypothetical protein